MYRYVVVDTNESSGLVAFRDPAGRHHVGHCLSVLPEIQDTLEGTAPALGFTMLIRPNGVACRVILTDTNCTQQHAFGLLYPLHAVPTSYSACKVARSAQPGTN